MNSLQLQPNEVKHSCYDMPTEFDLFWRRVTHLTLFGSMLCLMYDRISYGPAMTGDMPRYSVPRSDVIDLSLIVFILNSVG